MKHDAILWWSEQHLCDMNVVMSIFRWLWLEIYADLWVSTFCKPKLQLLYCDLCTLSASSLHCSVFPDSLLIDCYLSDEEFRGILCAWGLFLLKATLFIDCQVVSLGHRTVNLPCERGQTGLYQLYVIYTSFALDMWPNMKVTHPHKRFTLPLPDIFFTLLWSAAELCFTSLDKPRVWIVSFVNVTLCFTMHSHTKSGFCRVISEKYKLYFYRSVTSGSTLALSF